MANSINTNIAAYFAQANLTRASDDASSSVARLSSGNRIVRASDDVAALATGTSLLSTVSALRAAQNNAAQGSSLLQVADGALAQVQNILQQQKSIALQAGSGSLTDTDRGFLNQQFQALAEQINSLSDSTTFNGVKLINGSLSTGAAIQDATSQATAGSATLNFAGNIANAETVIINGVTLTAQNTTSATTHFQRAGTTGETVANLAAKLTELSQTTTYATSLGGAIYQAVGNSLVITSRTGGELGQNFTIKATGTGTVGTASSLGGAFGDSSFNVFLAGQGISSSTVSVVDAATADAAEPFVNGGVLAVTVDGAATTLYTVATGDSLTTIVTAINQRKAITGVTAQLVYDPTQQEYNIELSLKNTGESQIIFSGGTGVRAASLNGIQGSTTSQIFRNTQNLFDSNLTTATAGTDIVLQTATAASPFDEDDDTVIHISRNGVSDVLVYTIQDAETLTSLVAAINATTATSGIAAELIGSGGDFNVRLSYNGSEEGLTITYTSDTGRNTAADATTAGDADLTANFLTQTVRVGLDGGLDNGLGLGTTSVTGTVGDNLLTNLSQNKARVTVSFPDIAASALQDAGNFNSNGSVYLTIGGKNFAFTTTSNANKAPDEITIGATLKETLDNVVDTITRYARDYATGDVKYQLDQLNVTRDGNNLVIEGKGITNPVNILGGAASTIALTGFTNGATVSNSGLLNNASNITGGSYGVDVNGISSDQFTGTISGFTASYVSSNTVNVSVKVGAYTYTATNVPTNNTSNQTIRLFSDTLADSTNGGYFDIQLQANQGQVVTNQTEANTFAARLNGAFNNLTFTQQRTLSSYNGNQTIVANDTLIGSLIGSKVSANLPTFSGNQLSDVTVIAPENAGEDAVIRLTIDGQVYQSETGLGSKLGANQTYRFVNTSNNNFFVELTTGDSTIDFSTSVNASAVQTALAKAFGAGDGSAALSFQIGATADDAISVSIGSAKTSSIYNGLTLSVASQADAQTASSVLDTAIATVTALRASVGALGARFNFAQAALQSSVQNQDAARAQLLDTDIALESTAYATSQVKLQAGISVLAQANQQLQALLKLIG